MALPDPVPDAFAREFQLSTVHTPVGDEFRVMDRRGDGQNQDRAGDQGHRCRARTERDKYPGDGRAGPAPDGNCLMIHDPQMRA